jgi:hypothetical protein
MKKIFFLTLCFSIIFSRSEVFSQAYGTWEYSKAVIGELQPNVDGYGNILVTSDSSSLAIVFYSPDNVPEARILVKKNIDSVFVINDLLRTVFIVPLSQIAALTDSVGQYGLISTNTEVYNGQYCTVYESGLSLASSSVNHKVWIPANQEPIPTGIYIPIGLIPMMSVYSRIFPAKATIVLEIEEVSSSIEFILLNYSSSPTFALLEISDDYDVKGFENIR